MSNNGISSPNLWGTLSPYVTPPAAASVAIIPVFYGFVAKSAQQVGNPIPKMTLMEGFKGGLKASPTVGSIIGTQMIVQNLAEKMLIGKSLTKNSEPDFSQLFASAVIVGTISAPFLAVFNGQTMGQTARESLRRFTPKVAGAIVSRETSFLFSIRISGPVSDYMKNSYGESKVIEYGSAFFSGAIGSMVGHPADTALTLWQKEMKVMSFRHLLRGAPVKSLATGGFSVCYRIVKNIFDSYSV